MPKKKRTRKQKEKARQRRAHELQQIQPEDNRKIFLEDTQERSYTLPSISMNKPSSDQAATIDYSAKADLKKITVLMVLFVLLLSVLVVTESQYHYLTPLSREIINFLMRT
ncbi:hypothetical protein KJ903_01280 [Patescibacteria group bacterium]|nr:hypothetical protein [Patescibacteria group bacterium]